MLRHNNKATEQYLFQHNNVDTFQCKVFGTINSIQFECISPLFFMRVYHHECLSPPTSEGVPLHWHRIWPTLVCKLALAQRRRENLLKFKWNHFIWPRSNHQIAFSASGNIVLLRSKWCDIVKTLFLVNVSSVLAAMNLIFETKNFYYY